MSKEKLKTATNKVAKTIGDMAKHVEVNGAGVSEAEVDLIFDYLAATVEKTRVTARLRHSSFDFTMTARPAPVVRDRLVRGAVVEPDPQPDVEDVDGIVFLDDED